MDECMKSNYVQPQPARPESNFLVWTSHKSLSIIKWPVSRGMAIHFLSFKCFPPLRYTHSHRALVSALFVCVCVSKSFLCDRFCLPPGHYVSGPLHVFCQALFKTESTQSNMATHFLSRGIFNIFDRATSYDNQHVCRLPFFSFTALPSFIVLSSYPKARL